MPKTLRGVSITGHQETVQDACGVLDRESDRHRLSTDPVRVGGQRSCDIEQPLHAENSGPVSPRSTCASALSTSPPHGFTVDATFSVSHGPKTIAIVEGDDCESPYTVVRGTSKRQSLSEDTSLFR